MTAIRIFITDDHFIVRQGLHLILETADDIEVVGEAANGAECLRLVPELSPECDINGFTNARHGWNQRY